MTSHYKRAMEQIHLSPGRRQSIAQSLKKTAAQPRRHTAPVVILAAALCLILAIGAAADDHSVAHQILYSVSPAAAQFFLPVHRSSSDQGIALTVESTCIQGDTAQIHLTLKDLEGQRLSGGADLYDSLRLQTPFSSDLVTTGIQSLGSSGSNALGFLITIQMQDASGQWQTFSGRKFTCSMRQLLFGEKTTGDIFLPVRWDVLDTETARQYCTGGSNLDALYPGGCPEEVPMLVPSRSQEITGGIRLTAAGYVENDLRIQLDLSQAGASAHGQLWLTTPDGERIQPTATISSQQHTEYVFALSPEKLANCQLMGSFTYGGQILEGDWSVTFPIE